MGTRGPAPKPTALRILEGNPSGRPINRNEPKPRPIAPSCPTWLDASAKREWRRILPELERLGLATALDLGCLAGYCQSYSHWKAAEALVKEFGLMIRTGSERYTAIKANPAVAIAQAERHLMMQYGARLGLSPSDRGRLTVLGVADAEEEESPFDI